MSGAPDNITPTIAQRFVACKGWEWLPGMLTGTSLRVDDVGYKGRPMRVVWGTGLDGWTRQRTECYDSPSDGTHDVPDVDDDATRGCITGLVRKAWNDRTAGASPDMGGAWWVSTGVLCDGIRRDSEIECLLALLEAAP